jgi:hypothetical protein
MASVDDFGVIVFHQFVPTIMASFHIFVWFLPDDFAEYNALSV